jgi:hypothetical protein
MFLLMWHRALNNKAVATTLRPTMVLARWFERKAAEELGDDDNCVLQRKKHKKSFLVFCRHDDVFFFGEGSVAISARAHQRLGEHVAAD